MLKNKSMVASYVGENKYKIMGLIVFLVVGSILGIICANLLDDNTKVQLLEYIQTGHTYIMQEESNIDNMQIIKNTVKNILFYVFAISVLGCSIVFSPLIYAVILHKGFSISFCISFLIMLLGNVKGTIYALIYMFLPNCILILGIIYLSVLWLRFAQNILKNKELYGLKRKIQSNFIITAIITIILIILMIPVELFTNNILQSYIRII